MYCVHHSLYLYRFSNTNYYKLRKETNTHTQMAYIPNSVYTKAKVQCLLL